LDEEVNLWKGLKNRGEECFSLILDRYCKESYLKKEGERVSPPLLFPIENQKILLYGKIDLCTPSHLLSFGKCHISSLWKLWPKILIINLLKNKGVISPQTILFVEGGEELPIDVEDPEKWFAHYLRYYQLALKTPSPFLPTWIEAMRKKEEKKLEKLLVQEKERGTLFSSFPLLEEVMGETVKNDLDLWQGRLKEMFFPLFKMMGVEV